MLSTVRKTMGAATISCFNRPVTGNPLFNLLLKKYQCCGSGSVQ
jgi:hypothetical protein